MFALASHAKTYQWQATRAALKATRATLLRSCSVYWRSGAYPLSLSRMSISCFTSKRVQPIHHIIEQFERLGYYWAYRVVDTRGFGLAQRRRRVFVVAATDVDPRNILLADDAPNQHWPAPSLAKPIGFFWTEGNSGHGLTGDAIPPLKAGSGLAIPSTPAVLLPNGRVVTPPISVVERLQGFGLGWTNSLMRNRMDRHRWRLVGNAVSVPVSRWIGTRLSEPGEYDPAGCLSLELIKAGRTQHGMSVKGVTLLPYPTIRLNGALEVCRLLRLTIGQIYLNARWPDL